MEVDWKEKNILVNFFKRDFLFLRFIIIKLDIKRVFIYYGNDVIELKRLKYWERFFKETLM